MCRNQSRNSRFRYLHLSMNRKTKWKLRERYGFWVTASIGHDWCVGLSFVPRSSLPIDQSPRYMSVYAGNEYSSWSNIVNSRCREPLQSGNHLVGILGAQGRPFPGTSFPRSCRIPRWAGNASIGACQERSNTTAKRGEDGNAECPGGCSPCPSHSSFHSLGIHRWKLSFHFGGWWRQGSKSKTLLVSSRWYGTSGDVCGDFTEYDVDTYLLMQMVPRDWFSKGLIEDLKYYSPFGIFSKWMNCTIDEWIFTIQTPWWFFQQTVLDTRSIADAIAIDDGACRLDHRTQMIWWEEIQNKCSVQWMRCIFQDFPCCCCCC